MLDDIKQRLEDELEKLQRELNFELPDRIQKAVELNPNSADAWSGYWNFLLLMNRQEEALAAIRKAVELDPESSEYQTSLAEQLFRLSRAEEAIFVLRENIRRHPESPSGYIMLARYLNQVGRPGEAMWYLQSMRRRDPENPAVQFNVCQQHWQLWDLAEAAATCLEIRSWGCSPRHPFSRWFR